MDLKCQRIKSEINMFSKPDIKEDAICACVRIAYGIRIDTLTFLPIGADTNTAVYRALTKDKQSYFIKLRSGVFYHACVDVPHILKTSGNPHIISALPTRTHELWTTLGALKLIVYPYIEGRNAVEAGLSKQHWKALGQLVKTLHTLDGSNQIMHDIPRESFISPWPETVTHLLLTLNEQPLLSTVAVETQEFLKGKEKVIVNLIKRIEELTSKLQKQTLQHVVCHGDIHGWNLMLDQNEQMYLIDWDTLILAPKERDLMFIGAGIWPSHYTPDEEASLFFSGYGQTEINQDAVSYYRCERIIQDIGEYCQHIFFSQDNEADRHQSFEYLKTHFVENGTIDNS